MNKKKYKTKIHKNTQKNKNIIKTNISTIKLSDKLLVIFLLVLFTVIIQSIVTYNFTNTKRFSKRAFIRNFSFVICIYYYIKTKKIILLFIPFLIEFIVELLKYKGFHCDKYIATEYQYSDYWREINKKDPIFSNFSEGNCDKILGIDSTDISQENIKKILYWAKITYNNSIDKKEPFFVDFNGKKHNDVSQFKKITDDNKFKLICDICQIKPGMKILEVGFGEGDFINYIKKHYNIDVIGVSISDEQVKLIQSRGFKGYTMNSWEMTPDVIGTYDLILQCGNLEYILCTGESKTKYMDYCNIIKKLLNKNGKYFITCIHFNENFGKFSLYDNIRAYFLWSGNDGRYPCGKDGFTQYAEQTGLKTIFQQDRTNDYFITTILFMSFLRCSKNNKCINMFYFNDFLHALFKTIAGPYYLHTFLCYTPTNDFNWCPWQWEFISQYKNGEYVSPVTLQYILFQK